MKKLAMLILSALGIISAQALPIGQRTLGSQRLEVKHYEFVNTPAHAPRVRNASRINVPAALQAPMAAGAITTAAAATPEVGKFYGYLSFSGMPATKGLNLIQPTGEYEGLWSDPLLEQSASLMCGWYYNGRICGYVPYFAGEGIYKIDYAELNFANGDVQVMKTLNLQVLFMSATLNENDGYVYGYASTTSGLAYARCPADDPTNISIVKDIPAVSEDEVCQSLTYNPVDKTIYGVSMNGNFVKIDRLGNQTVLFSLASVGRTDALSGLCYSTTHDRFFWNYVDDTRSAFYWISTTEKSATLIYDYIALEQFNFIIAGNETYYADAPAKAKFVRSNFDKGSTSGSLLFSVPQLRNDGTQIPSGTQIGWSLSIDGAKALSGTTTPGAYLTIPVSNLATGIRTFTLQLSIGDHTGLSVPVSLYIGIDTPSAPANVKLDQKGHLTWDAVTTGAHDGYIDPAGVSYIILLNDEQAGTTSETSFDITLPEDQSLTPYIASVIAVFNNQQSDPSISNTVIAGRPLEPEVYLMPTSAECELFTVEDANGDNVSWEYWDFGDGDGIVFFSGYTDEQRMDDWLFLPAINFANPEAFYNFEFQAHYFSLNYPAEFLEVKFGKEPTAEAMTGNVMATTRIIEPEFATYGGRFRVDEAGTYYIGVHCMSLAEMAGISTRRFKVSKLNVTDASVGAVTDISAEIINSTEGDEIRTTAKVTFTMPTTTIGGDPLASDAQVTATVKGATTASVTGMPGTKQSAEVLLTGVMNRIDIVTSLNGQEGDQTWYNLYTGNSIPAQVDNLRISASEDNMTAMLSWLAPIEDINENIINDPDDLYYNVFIYDMETSSWVAVGQNIYSTHFEYTLEKGWEQTILQFGVQACNSIGVNTTLVQAPVMVGTPTNVPFSETFTNLAKLHSGFFYHTPTADYGVNWGFLSNSEMPVPPSTDNSNVLIFQGTSRMPICRGRMNLPTFTTRNCTEGSFRTKIWTGANAASTSFLYEYYGSTELKELCTIEGNNGWEDVAVDLPDDALGKGWVRIYIDTDINREGQYFAMSEYSLSYMSGINEADYNASDVEITAVKGGVVVNGAAGSAVAIYTPDGRLVAYRANASDSEIFSLTAGLYIVKAGDTTAKIAL